MGRHVSYVQYHKNHIPCRTYMHDVHMATYTMGEHGPPLELANKLRKTGMPIIVLVFTSDVCDNDEIYKAIIR